MFHAKRNSEFYIFGKSPRARPKPDIRKPGPARGPKKLGPARPKPGNFRPVTSLFRTCVVFCLTNMKVHQNFFDAIVKG